MNTKNQVLPPSVSSTKQRKLPVRSSVTRTRTKSSQSFFMIILPTIRSKLVNNPVFKATPMHKVQIVSERGALHTAQPPSHGQLEHHGTGHLETIKIRIMIFIPKIILMMMMIERSLMMMIWCPGNKGTHAEFESRSQFPSFRSLFGLLPHLQL